MGFWAILGTFEAFFPQETAIDFQKAYSIQRLVPFEIFVLLTNKSLQNFQQKSNFEKFSIFDFFGSF